MLCPSKGALIDWLGEQPVRDLVRFGIRDTVILKSDQERAIVDVLNEIAWMRGEGGTIIEHSPVADAQANGFCGARHPDRGLTCWRWKTR